MNQLGTPILIGTLLLAGCGGSGGGDGCAPGEFCDINEDLSQTVADAGFASLEEASEVLDQPSTNFSDLPTSGVSAYEGVLALQLEEEGEVIIGRTDLTVRFGGNDSGFSGTASEFVGEMTGGFGGTLDVTDGLVLEGAQAFVTAVDDALGNASSGVVNEPENGEDFAGIVADLSGTLTSSSNVATQLDGNIVGTFAGEDAAMVGLAFGEAASNANEGEFLGILIAIDEADAL